MSLSSKKGLQFSSNGLLLATTRNGYFDEIEGYKAQYGFQPSSLPGSVSNSSDIDLKYLANLRGSDNQPVYKALFKQYGNQIKQMKINKKMKKKQQKNNGSN